MKAGEQICDGRYSLLKRVGKNPTANVWLATDNELEEKVLIYALHKHVVKEPSRKRVALDGVRRMAKFEHPGLLWILEPKLESDGETLYVKEHVEGESLRDAVLEGHMTTRESLAAISRVGNALGYAHARGMVHRDVNPTSILIDTSGSPRISDLSASSSRSRKATPQEIATDVYTLAMTALFVLHGDDLPMLDVMRDASGFVAGLDCSDALKAVLTRATQLNKNERYPDAKSFCTDLDNALAGRAPAAAPVAAATAAATAATVAATAKPTPATPTTPKPASELSSEPTRDAASELSSEPTRDATSQVSSEPAGDAASDRGDEKFAPAPLKPIPLDPNATAPAPAPAPSPADSFDPGMAAAAAFDAPETVEPIEPPLYPGASAGGTPLAPVDPVDTAPKPNESSTPVVAETPAPEEKSGGSGMMIAVAILILALGAGLWFTVGPGGGAGDEAPRDKLAQADTKTSKSLATKAQAPPEPAEAPDNKSDAPADDSNQPTADSAVEVADSASAEAGGDETAPAPNATAGAVADSEGAAPDASESGAADPTSTQAPEPTPPEPTPDTKTAERDGGDGNNGTKKPAETKAPPKKRSLASTLKYMEKRVRTACTKLVSGPTKVTLELSLRGDEGRIKAKAQGSHAVTSLGKCVTNTISRSNYRPYTPGKDPVIKRDIAFD